MGSISKEDLKDADIVDAVELAATGLTAFRSISVVSTTSGSFQVTFAAATYLYQFDDPIQVGDKLILTGTTGADGTYTVASFVAENILTVSTAIATSTGGTANFYYVAGALNVGVDNTLLTQSSGTTVQKVLEDFDAVVATGGFNVNRILTTTNGEVLATSIGNLLITG